MKTKNSPNNWIFIAAGALAIALYLFSAIEIGPTNSDIEPLPIGTIEDLKGLANRDDVNILFILVDTLRANRMGAYGYERNTTPFISKLAKTSVLFKRHIAQSSWTKSSMASMWTSLYPIRAGVTKFDHTISPDAQMPAEILSEEGFKTVAIVRNGWVQGYFGFDQGFNKYFRPMGTGVNPNEQRLRPNQLSHGADENIVKEAIEFLRIHGKSSRWLLYLHLMDLHEYTYDAESAVFGNATSDIYDNSILRTDWLISTLHAGLRRLGLEDRTIIVILSDHGEAFGERGFEGHAKSALPETTETPFILSLPFSLDPGVVIQSATTNVDVWPTLFDLLGIQGPGDIDGRSRLPEILHAAANEAGDFDSDPDPLFSYLDENWGQNTPKVKSAISVIQGPYRFVAGRNASGKAFEALFLLEDEQKKNQIMIYPEIAERLRTLAAEHVESSAAFEIGSVEMDEMQLNQLRALGYQLP
ncbi:MAG: sulfatase [Myxococcota bacterium]